MSKSDDLRRYLLENIGKWACSFCGSNSNQPAAIFRIVKNEGYRFEETSPNRWAKTMLCPVCGVQRTHYKLLSATPEYAEKKRLGIRDNERERIFSLLGLHDAFTGATIRSTPEVDHKIPLTRLAEDYDVSSMSDIEIINSFQILTREHNLLKDRMCGQCKKTGKRPPFFEISFWYDGDSTYRGTCEGCGWYDGVRWRKAANEKLSGETSLFDL